MKSLSTSLRCFAHPLSLLSLGVLLLNDHVLKILIPSWLTGKLSDFAGVFFFPFLLAALLAFVWRDRLSVRQTGALAFAITALWFVLMKTTAWGNDFTQQFSSLVLHTRTQIVRDPSDVMALGVMFPAWALWDKPQEGRPPRWAWVVLLLAAFASMATTPWPPPPSINQVSARDNTFIATGYSIPLATSMNGGVTWVISQEQYPKNLSYPDTFRGICEPTIPQICYRIQVNARPAGIEETLDSGTTWQLVWQFPPGRLPMLERLGTRGCGIGGCQRTFDPGPNELALGAPIGSNGRSTLIAALGTEGVLVRSPEGVWQQVGVGSAQPTPIQIYSLNQIDVIGYEIEVVLYAALCVFIVLAVSGWMFMGGWKILDLLSPLWLSIVLVLIVIYLIWTYLTHGQAGWGTPVLVLWSMLALVACLHWGKVRVPENRVANRVPWLALGLAILFAGICCLPMLAWALGWIPEYRNAVLGALLCATLLIILEMTVMILFVRRNSRPHPA